MEFLLFSSRFMLDIGVDSISIFPLHSAPCSGGSERIRLFQREINGFPSVQPFCRAQPLGGRPLRRHGAAHSSSEAS